MPTYPGDIQDKLDALQALTGAQRRTAELCVIYWPSPTGIKVYAAAKYTELSWWPNLAAAIETYFAVAVPITLTLIPDSTPFIDLPRAASVSDDSINLTFDDTDNAFSGFLMTYGEGIRTEVFCYWPAVDLLLSLWRGMLHQPKDMNREQVKITATAGWRAGQMLVPKRPHGTSCTFIFGALLSSQAEIDYHNGCPYNVHIGGSIGVPGFTDCPRRVKADCVQRLATEVYWPGFETRPDAIPNNQTKGPNLLAKAIGNESNLSDPIRAIAGERYVKALNLLAFRIEEDTNHPEDGFGAALFEVAEGHLLALWEFRINGQLVGTEHQQKRLGELGQAPTDWSPDVNSYSGTAVIWGRIQGDFRGAQASDFTGSVRALGSDEVRVYSDPNTFVNSYTKNRTWCLLKILAEARWGYGQDYPRFDIQSFIDAAAWCDEFVTLTDINGNTFSGVRSTFNAEVTARAIQQQVKDICTAGRLGIPFEFEGKDVIVPLRAEDVSDPTIPVFTDEGPNRNIVYDGAKSSLTWSVINDDTMTNQWTVNFDDNSNGGVDTQFIFGDQPQQLRAGRAWGDRSKRVINKSQAGYGITSAQEAARFGNSLLYLGPLDSGGILNPFSVKFTTWYSEAFNVQNYKIIKVDNAKLQSRMAQYFTARGLSPYPDADYTVFRVMKYTRKGDLRVEIEAQQYATLDIVLSEPECEPVAGMEFWYKFDEYAGGTQPDASPHGRDLSLTTGSPTLSGDPIPGLTLTAATKLTGSTDAAQNFEDGLTLFFAIKEPAFVNNKSLISKLDTAPGPFVFRGWDLGRTNFGLNKNFYCFFADYSPTSGDDYYADEDSVHVWPGEFDTSLHIYTYEFYREGSQNQLRIVCRRDGAVIDTQVRGVDNQHAPMVFPAADNPAALTIGDVYGSSSGMVATLYEVIGYRGQMSALEITANENYLRNKFSNTGTRRTYSTPEEVGQVQYNNTWSGIAAPAGTQADDLMVMMIRSYDATDWVFDIDNLSTPGTGWINSSINVGLDNGVFPGETIRIRYFFRVAQGSSESWNFVDGGKTTPERPFTIHITTVRGVAVATGALGGTAYNNIGAYGEVPQDTAFNFDLTGFTYQPPTTKCGPLFAAHDNSLFYKVLAQDTGSPVITTSVVPEGRVPEFDNALGGSWFSLGFIFEADSSPIMDAPVPGCGDIGDTFSAPTDFGAEVNPATGVVHLHWGPPATHPEMVTGYTLYESDGVTVAQATAYDFDADVALPPGTYTYRVNATDGVTVSGFASVTFTMPDPPVTGTDLFVVDDPTLENILDDITLEQVTD